MWDIEERVREENYEAIKNDTSMTEYQKNQRMYNLMTDAIVDEMGTSINGLRASLEFYYGNYLSTFEKMKAANADANWRLGYTSNNSLYTANTDDPTTFGGSWGGRTVDRNAADITKERVVTTEELLTAIKNGETELTIGKELQADGTYSKGRTYKLNADGLNFLKRMTAYNNSNTVHDYFGPIFGSNLQTKEHGDTVNMALAAAKNAEAVYVSTDAGRQAATNAKYSAEAVIAKYRAKVNSELNDLNTEAASEAKTSASVKAREAVENNTVNSDTIYKKAQDVEAAKTAMNNLEAEKQGALKAKYSYVPSMLSEYSEELAKIKGTAEYKTAAEDAKKIVQAYNAGTLTDENRSTSFSINGKTMSVDLDSDTMAMVKTAAASGQQFGSDLVAKIIDTKRSVGDGADTSPAAMKKAYSTAIKDLEADTKANGIDHSFQIKKLKQEAYDKYKINLWKNNESYASGGSNGGTTTSKGKKTAANSGYDLGTTGFNYEGKAQEAKYAGSQYYTFKDDGSESTKRASVIEAVTEPVKELLKNDSGKVSQASERMLSNAVVEAETMLRDENTSEKVSGEAGVKVTTKKLATALNKTLPDAEIWTQAENSGVIKTLSTLDKSGISPASFSSELKRILSANPTMDVNTRTDFVNTISLLDMISNNKSTAKLSVGSIDTSIDAEGGSFADVLSSDTTLGATKGLTLATESYTPTGAIDIANYDRTAIQDSVQSFARVSELVSKGGAFESELLAKRTSDLDSARTVTKAATSDFRQLAKSYYDKAVTTPTEANKRFVELAEEYSVERQKAAAANNDRLKDVTFKPKVTDLDCIHALGVANYEEIISPYGNKNGQTYSEYLAAQNNAKDYTWSAEDGYSAKATDAYKLGSNNFGNHLEQMSYGAQRLAEFFPEDADALNAKSQEYFNTYVAPQYQTVSQKNAGIQGTLANIAGSSLLDDATYTVKNYDGSTTTRNLGYKDVASIYNQIEKVETYDKQLDTIKKGDMDAFREAADNYDAASKRLMSMYNNVSVEGGIGFDEFVGTIKTLHGNMKSTGYDEFVNAIGTTSAGSSEDAFRSVLAQVSDEGQMHAYETAVSLYESKINNLQRIKDVMFKGVEQGDGTALTEMNAAIASAKSDLATLKELNTKYEFNDGKVSFFTGKQLTDNIVDNSFKVEKAPYIGDNLLEVTTSSGKTKTYKLSIEYEMGGDNPNVYVYTKNNNMVNVGSQAKDTAFVKAFNEKFSGLTMDNEGNVVADLEPDYRTLPTQITNDSEWGDVQELNRVLLQRSLESVEDMFTKVSKLEKGISDENAKITENIAAQEAKIESLNGAQKDAYYKYLMLTQDLEKEKSKSAEYTKAYNEAREAYEKSYKTTDINEIKMEEALSKEEYAEYKKALEEIAAADDFLNDKTGKKVYQDANGVVFMQDGSVPTGFTDLRTAMELLGYNGEYEHMTKEEIDEAAKSKDNKKAFKKMQKEINANQNKGSVHWKNSEEYKGLENLDYASQKYTLAGLVELNKQFKDYLVDNGNLANANILVSKDYMDLMQRVSKVGEDIPLTGNGFLNSAVDKFVDFSQLTTELAKATQDWQLAGGFSNINAATLSQIRGAIFNDPLKAKEYLSVFLEAKNSNAVAKLVTENRQFVYDMVLATHDQTILSDLNAALTAQKGIDDAGTLQTLTSRILGHLDGEIQSDSKMKWFGRLEDDMNALFSDATFKNTLPLLRLKMLQVNYDEAIRYMNSNMDNFDADTKARLSDTDYAKSYAMKMSYAKTLDFFEPRKTRGQDFDSVMNKIFTEDERQVAASWTGAKRTDSIMDKATNIFFALRWKMTFGGRVINGMTDTPGALIRGISNAKGNATESSVATQFMRSGNRTGVGVMMLLSAGAMLWNHALGYDSVSWDDLSPIGIDGEWQVPPILLKFQTIGQMIMPNAYDETGEKGLFGFYIDPNKDVVKTDPFSSIFTISNSVARTIDRATNANNYNTNIHRGIVFSGSSNDAINQVLNSDILQAVGDELIAANLLSPYKAMYEVIMDDTYYGNNIWEKKYLPDGTENKNYDPFRNVVASVFHILNWDTFLGNGTNKWVKGYGSSDYVNSGRIGTVSGSGIFQHEYISAAIKIAQGETLEGIAEAGELPIKFGNIASSARTEFNTSVKNIITRYVDEYKEATGSDMLSVDAKDEEYAKLVKKCADVVANWSAQNDYVLGQNQELVAYTTQTLMAVCAGEYDDNLDYVQRAYWQASQIAQIENGQDLFLNDADLEEWVASGKTEEEFAEEKNRRSNAYNQALDNEYQARLALIEAGVPSEYFSSYSYENYKAQQRAVNKECYTSVMNALNSKVGEFDNFQELKAYYEEQIEAATDTDTKAKLADKYNTILTDTIAPYINKYGNGLILTDGYYNGKGMAANIADYVIMPADQYYYGKSPRASYLKDLFGVGYRNTENLPSDQEVLEIYTGAIKKLSQGSTATATSMLDRIIQGSKSGKIYVSDADYSKIVRLKAQLSARSK